MEPADRAAFRHLDRSAPADGEVLERAVVKLVRLGERAGVTSEQMIELLRNGLTVGELVDYLALCADGHRPL